MFRFIIRQTLAIVLATSVLSCHLRSADPAVGNAVITDAISAGVQLERDGRWHEAIQFYERLIKSQPGLNDIERRLQISRIHHDVVRRYNDESFLTAVRTTSPAQAAELYMEVLTKLEMNYVDPTDLSKLVRYGTAFLEVALTEPDFVRINLASVSDAKIEHFRNNIHKIALARPVRSRAEAKSIASQVAQLAEQELGLLPSVTIHEYVAGAVGLLDPYSGYMTPGELMEIFSQIEGNLIGLGVELWAERNELRILEVFAGGPAFEAGLRAGDSILAVDNSVTSQVGAKRAADMLRGVEGSSVRLEVLRSNGEAQSIVVTRRRVDVPSVSTGQMVDTTAGVGYIRISTFQKTTPEEFDRVANQLYSQGMKSLIIDLRRNPGGLLDAAVELVDRFVDHGSIVSTRGRSGLENRDYRAKRPNTWDIPLVVLVDSDSASASEIFAGAIRDHRRGILVGQTTYGKGSVQGLFHTETTSGGLRLTVSKFFSPNGTPISSIGVQPDVVLNDVQVAKPIADDHVPTFVRFDEPSQDLSLGKAIEVARDSIAHSGYRSR